MSEQSDEELVRAYQAGDEVAFTEFAARHEDRVYRMAMIWLQDVSLAADVLQETLYRSYTGLGRFRFRASPSTWLLRICRNVCHEENRRSTRLIPLPEDYPGEGFTPCFDGDRDRSVMAARMWQALGELPERQREVVTLRLLEELSVAQTAHIMGCRPGTVKAHLNKALTSLKKRMGVGDRTDGS
jgi:RNA polymerase sigma-70 factor (ECF subfamily)